jgi:hypothetical protein
MVFTCLFTVENVNIQDRKNQRHGAITCTPPEKSTQWRRHVMPAGRSGLPQSSERGGDQNEVVMGTTRSRRSFKDREAAIPAESAQTNSDVNSNFSESTSPRSVTFSAGMGDSARKDSVMKGSGSVQPSAWAASVSASTLFRTYTSG